MQYNKGYEMNRWIALIVFLIVIAMPGPSQAQNDEMDGPPFSMPFDTSAGPDTWFYEQHYGNSTGAYNYGDDWYAAGQGMHFGIDLKAPCGTPVHAIADGVVRYVDASGFGSLPHSLVLDHPGTGYSSLYGHLYSMPAFVRGDVVERGQVIGETGDPDMTCGSRPHLHLEIRNENYADTYNPIPLIEANWHMLASMGPGANGFQIDLDAPYRWRMLEDQPDVHFGGNLLNNYEHTWPPRIEVRAPVNPPADRHLDPLPDEATVTRSTVSEDQWNVGLWWLPGDEEAVYLFDYVPGQTAGVFRQSLDGSERTYVEPAPPATASPNGDVTVRKLDNGAFEITRLADGSRWEVYTDGYYPAVSPDGTRLLWEIVYGEIVPGQDAPGVQFWVSDLDGQTARHVGNLGGGYSQWLDAHRLLLARRITYTSDTELYLLDIDDPAMTPVKLGTYSNMRGLSISPGGAWIAYWISFQENSADNGVFVQRTEIDSTPIKLDFFGPYQWRDDQSLFTLSFDSTTDVHTLGYIDIEENVLHTLTDPDDLPIRIANGDWSVSPDGTQIVYVDPTDYGLYRLTIEP
jgi:hypothetical protein